MRVQHPVIGTNIENIGVSDFLVVPHLNLGKFSPLNHLRLQVQVVIHSIVVEFFLCYLVSLISQSAVHPVKDIESADTVGKNIHIHVASDNVQSK